MELQLSIWLRKKGHDNAKMTALLDKNAKLEFKDISNPLILAALEDSAKVTELLLKRGIRLNDEELKDLTDFYEITGEQILLLEKFFRHMEKKSLHIKPRNSKTRQRFRN